MGRIVDRIQTIALALGAPGLFIVAFLDSSLLSLPEIADLLVVWMVTQRPSRAIVYAVSATVGSLTGCLLLFAIGRRGGDALVTKRFNSAAVNRARASFQRYGVMAVLIPSILPPPAPFKIFVLLAGVSGISVGRFSAAILIGRGARYSVLALLAIRYGEQAMTFLRENGRVVSLVVVGLVVVGFVAYLVWARRQRRSGEAAKAGVKLE